MFGLKRLFKFFSKGEKSEQEKSDHKNNQIEDSKKNETALEVQPIPQAKRESFNRPAAKKQITIKNQTQIDNIESLCQINCDKNTEEADIVVGFDFGTSSSKLVIRDSSRQIAFAVPWGDLSCDGNKYLLPTRIFINTDGQFSLIKGDHFSNTLKVDLMDNPGQIIFSETDKNQSVNAIELVTVYMAMVLRYARKWFLEHNKKIYQNSDIFWHLNLGVPSKNYNDSHSDKNLLMSAIAAWRLSCINGPFTTQNLRTTIQKIPEFLKDPDGILNQEQESAYWLHPDYINIHPEVIMEIVGYARSSMRTNGLHLLIDIGATTMDMATFIIHSKDGDDVFPLLETSVKRYGTMVLHGKRLAAIMKAIPENTHLDSNIKENINKIKSIDPTKNLPGLKHYQILSGKVDLQKVDNDFFKACSVELGNIIRDTKERRDPHANAWDSGLPVFICGGGGRLAAYHKMVKNRGDAIAKRVTNFGNLIIKDIPKPDQLEAPELMPKDYDRLAVAYGLSFDSFEIGEVIPESKIKDIRLNNKRSSRENKYVSKEMC